MALVTPPRFSRPATHSPGNPPRRAYPSRGSRAAYRSVRTILHRMDEPRIAPATGFRIETTVRDALYDRIPLGRPDVALIGTTAFSRLERIQQLGFVSRV